jgi:anti-sigma B factor antagonist
MRKTRTPVLIQRLPQKVNGESVRIFMRSLEDFLKSDGPRMVFDLSQVEEMDAAGVDMLLTCMTEAAKRDGDLKLAGPSPRALVILELTQMDRLFEIFETPAEAAASFGVVLAADYPDEVARGQSVNDLEAQQEAVPGQQPELRRGRKFDSDVA